MHFAEILAGKARRENPQHQAVLQHRVLIKVALALNAGLALRDAFIVAAETEGVDVKVVPQEGEGAAAYPQVFVVIDDVFVKSFVVRAAEGPARQLPVVSAQRIHDDAILIRQFVALGGNRSLNALFRLRRHHEGVRRDLAGIQLHQEIHVALQHLKTLAAEAEDHVDVGGGEKFECFSQAVVNLGAAAELVVAFRQFQDRIVKTLHADRHAIHVPLKSLKGRGVDFRRVGFAGHFLNAGEELAGVIDRFHQFFFDDGRRAAADVHAREVVAQGLHVVHFLSEVHEVFARLVFLKEETVEGAVAAKRLAERNMGVEKVLVAGLGGRRPIQNHRVAVEVFADVEIHDAVNGVDHPVGHQCADRFKGFVCHGEF